MKLAVLALLGCCAGSPRVAAGIRVAVAQIPIAPDLKDSRDCILEWIAKAAARGARVVVFPESSLASRRGEPEQQIGKAVDAIRAAARQQSVYVLFGGWSWEAGRERPRNWMKVIGPNGAELVHYDKLWDLPGAATPGLFTLDGVAASAVLCADRWLRAIEDLPAVLGAQVSFELADNYAAEWLPELEWYWYVARALRNGVYVVFANSANSTGSLREPISSSRAKHGHSAIIAPDGAVLAASRDDRPAIVVADIEPRVARRSEALARAAHPVLGRFWEAGMDLLAGRSAPGVAFRPRNCASVELAVAAAQFAELPDAMANAAAMRRQIARAAGLSADLVAFGELALTGGKLRQAEEALQAVCNAAREFGVTVVLGLPWREAGRWFNAAVVVGADGRLLTRYHQFSAAAPFAQGRQPESMWFELKGVPAVVTIGRDGLWNEIAELAAVAGARLHVHLARELTRGETARLRRRQLGAALSSFQTLTVIADQGGASAVWDDTRGFEETRAFLRGGAQPAASGVKVFASFCANLADETSEQEGLVVVRRRVPGPNPYHAQRTSRFHPAMRLWYEFGAALLMGGTSR